jgi:hypothetical protein
MKIALAAHRPKKVIVFNRKLGARVPFKKYDVDYDAVIYGSEELAYLLTLHIHYTFCILQEQLETKRRSSDTATLLH